MAPESRVILLVTEQFDPTADAVIARLHARGLPLLRWNVDLYPLASSLTLRPVDGVLAGTLHTDGRQLDLRQIGSAWLRSFQPVGFPADLQGEELRFAQRQAQSMLAGLARASRWLWINHPEADRRASSKLLQLCTAEALGLEVPPTLMSNDPAAIQAFYEACQRHMIYKAFSQSLDLSPGQALFTGLVTPAHLASLAAIRATPGIFQRYVAKAYDLRVTIVGDTVFPVAIYSQEVEEAKIDWRAMPDPSLLRHAIHALPPQIEARLLALMQRLDLVYGAGDLIVTPDGRYVFLELNPSGQYGWIEAMTGLPITDCLVDALSVQGAPKAG